MNAFSAAFFAALSAGLSAGVVSGALLPMNPLPFRVAPITGDATWVDVLALVLILAGAILCVTAAIGLLRFRDVPSRLHAATKPQVLGLILINLAIALSLRSWPVVAFLIPVVLFQLATAPLSAHMVGRQAYRNGTIDTVTLVVDELADRDRDRENDPDGDRDRDGASARDGDRGH